MTYTAEVAACRVALEAARHYALLPAQPTHFLGLSRLMQMEFNRDPWNRTEGGEMKTIGEMFEQSLQDKQDKEIPAVPQEVPQPIPHELYPGARVTVRANGWHVDIEIEMPEGATWRDAKLQALQAAWFARQVDEMGVEALSALLYQALTGGEL